MDVASLLSAIATSHLLMESLNGRIGIHVMDLENHIEPSGPFVTGAIG
jgi:hypothetical protein